MSPGAMTEHRYFCSTSNLAFESEAELKAHYKSDFHRYNLKRKVAQLQPVTREWFEARRSKLAAADKEEVEKIWICPLTKKKFASEKTYLSYTQTKKYKDALKKSGLPAPEPTVIDKPKPKEPTEEEMKAAAAGAAVKGKGVKMQEGEEDDDDSGWETASEADEDDVTMTEDGASVAEWDARRCLFSNHMSASLEENLEYMFRKFGFILPDMEYCTDVEGLLKYLGAKVGQAHIPLMESALVDEGKIFRSAHAVQRHMIDKNQCRVIYDGNEEEYEEYYDYSGEASTSAAGGGQLMAIDQEGPRLEMGVAGELVVGAEPGGGGGKVLGTRELARYYRQKYRPNETRDSVLVNSAIARYRNLGIATARKAELIKLTVAKKSSEGQYQKKRGRDLRDQVNNVVNYNLPRNVPY